MEMWEPIFDGEAGGPKEPSNTDILEPIRKLVERFRCRSAAMKYEDWSGQGRRQVSVCADELAALLPELEESMKQREQANHIRMLEKFKEQTIQMVEAHKKRELAAAQAEREGCAVLSEGTGGFGCHAPAHIANSIRARGPRSELDAMLSEAEKKGYEAGRKAEALYMDGMIAAIEPSIDGYAQAVTDRADELHGKRKENQ